MFPAAGAKTGLPDRLGRSRSPTIPLHARTSSRPNSLVMNAQHELDILPRCSTNGSTVNSLEESMIPASHRRTWRERALVSVLLVSLTSFTTPVSAQNVNADKEARQPSTETPIKHVIVLIGENRTFDHLFATYEPRSGETVKNLLSEEIINADGTPGKNFDKAAQSQAIAPFKTQFYISLDNDEKSPYTTLPEPGLNFSPSPVTGEPPPFPFADIAFLGPVEPSLETADLVLLTTGASGAEQTAEFLNPATGEILDADTRIANFNKLPNGPFPLTGNPTATG